jgi:hypothetical protein
MEDGLEDIFLTFCNLQLKGNPNKISKVIKVAEQHFRIHPETKGYITEVISHMERFESNFDMRNSSIIDEIHNEWSEHERVIDESPDMIGLNSVYGYLYEGCNRCPTNIWHPTELCEDYEIGQFKCYECSQIQFKHLLGETISKGPFYAKRSGTKTKVGDIMIGPLLEIHSDQGVVRKFLEFATGAYKFYRKSIGYEGWIEKSNVKTIFFPIPLLEIGDNSIFRINDFLFGIAGISLIEYLFENDIKKIKQCPYCEKFFIAKDIRRESRCYSEKCEKVYQRYKKRKQREKDPVKYI